MGRELRCRASYGDREGEGKALLETTELIFRGDDKSFRFKVPFAKLKKVIALGDRLLLDGPGIKAVLELGPRYAASWAEKIKNPPTLLDKLGVTAESRVVVLGVTDPEFKTTLNGRVPKVSWGKVVPEAEFIFLAANRREDLDAIEALKASLAADGGLWIVRPKAAAEIGERDVKERARAAGLLDVKVCAFSATHTAEKLVVPRAKKA